MVGGETWVDSTQYGIVLARTDSLGDTTWVHHLLNVDHGSGYVCALRGGGFVASGTRNSFHMFARGFSTFGDSAWSYDPSIHGRVNALRERRPGLGARYTFIGAYGPGRGSRITTAVSMERRVA